MVRQINNKKNKIKKIMLYVSSTCPFCYYYSHNFVVCRHFLIDCDIYGKTVCVRVQRTALNASIGAMCLNALVSFEFFAKRIVLAIEHYGIIFPKTFTHVSTLLSWSSPCNLAWALMPGRAIRGILSLPRNVIVSPGAAGHLPTIR